MNECKVEIGAEKRPAYECTCDPQEIAERFEKGIADAETAIAAKVEATKRIAERVFKRGQYAAEDGKEFLTSPRPQESELTDAGAC